MDEPNILDYALNKELQDAIKDESTRVPDSAIADFEGNPTLAWENPWNPHNYPNPRYSECVTATRALFEILTTRIPAAKVHHFSSAYNDGRPLISEVVDQLLSPGFGVPFSGINHGGMATIDMGFVMKVIGGSLQDHLEWSKEKQRPILKRESTLLQQGREMGIPDLYMQWLGGANSEATLRIPLATLRMAKMVRDAAVSLKKE